MNKLIKKTELNVRFSFSLHDTARLSVSSSPVFFIKGTYRHTLPCTCMHKLVVTNINTNMVIFTEEY